MKGNHQIISVPSKIGRREFLQQGGLAGAGLVLGMSWITSAKAAPAIDEKIFKPSVFLSISSDGKIIIFSNRVTDSSFLASSDIIVGESC